MKLRTLAALALATSAVSFAAPASAADKMMGLRFEFGGSLAGGSSSTAVVAGEDVVIVQQSPIRGDIRVGYDLPGGLTPLIGLSFRNVTNSIKDGESDGTTLFALNVEGRYYFKPHKKGLSPFVFGGVDFTNFSFGHEDKDGKATRELADAVAGDEASSWGLNAGLGMEWLASKSFGVGGKWGLNANFAPTSVQKKDGAELGEDASHTRWGTDASFYLVWRI